MRRGLVLRGPTCDRAMTRAFVFRVIGVVYLCRLFSVLLLTMVSHYQAPVAWTGSHPNYFSMTARTSRAERTR